jgi:hypothetical protein
MVYLTRWEDFETVSPALFALAYPAWNTELIILHYTLLFQGCNGALQKISNQGKCFQSLPLVRTRLSHYELVELADIYDT